MVVLQIALDNFVNLVLLQDFGIIQKVNVFVLGQRLDGMVLHVNVQLEDMELTVWSALLLDFGIILTILVCVLPLELYGMEVYVFVHKDFME